MRLFTKGHRVSQSDYGPGTVTSSDERYTIIEFDGHGRRVFVTDMVKLDQTDVPAPEKAKKEKRKKAAVATKEVAAKPAATKTTKTAVTKAAAAK